MSSGGGAHAGHGHGDGDSDDDEDQDFFAGGEKSGLAVQNPDELKRKILEKAQRSVTSLIILFYTRLVPTEHVFAGINPSLPPEELRAHRLASQAPPKRSAAMALPAK